MKLMRRAMLKRAGAAALFAVLLRPLRALAAEWNKLAFGSQGVDDAFKFLGAAGAKESKEVVITAPNIAENGAAVPISVLSRIPNTVSIAVFVDRNPLPLAGSFEFAGDAVPEVSLRLKFAESSRLRAVVLAGGKAYTAHREVAVPEGGCGA